MNNEDSWEANACAEMIIQGREDDVLQLDDLKRTTWIGSIINDAVIGTGRVISDIYCSSGSSGPEEWRYKNLLKCAVGCCRTAAEAQMGQKEDCGETKQRDSYEENGANLEGNIHSNIKLLKEGDQSGRRGYLLETS